eukprot:g12624.t1
MGKYRGHQDKSRRGRENKLLKKKAGKGGGGARLETAGSPGGPPRQQQSGKTGAAGKAAAAGAGAGTKRKLKHVTYAKEHSVLICGDGDFSFTRGVIRHRGTGKGVVATSLDSRRTVLKKYPRAETWLPKLDADGAQVVHSVDATRLEETLLGSGGDGGDGEGGEGEEGKRVLFDRVVFNFPHTGKQRTHLNRNLIRDFFASTKGLVKCAPQGGEVHVTLKDKPPYSGWNVKAMAKESQLVLVRTLAFDPSVFPGYRHSTTDPQAKEFDAVGARTNVFCRARSPLDDNVDESGSFPVIVQPETACGNKDNNPSAENNGSRKADGEKIDSDGDSDGGLFGNGGDGESDSDEEAGGKDAVSAGSGDSSRTSGSGGKRREGKKNKEGSEGGSVDRGGNAAEEGTETGGKENESSKRGMLRPPVEKKRAAKRRAQRKKKAAAAREAAAAAAATTTAGEVSEGAASPAASGGKQKSSKRKRGKYVVASKKRPRNEQG